MLSYQITIDNIPRLSYIEYTEDRPSVILLSIPNQGTPRTGRPPYCPYPKPKQVADTMSHPDPLYDPADELDANFEDPGGHYDSEAAANSSAVEDDYPEVQEDQEISEPSDPDVDKAVDAEMEYQSEIEQGHLARAFSKALIK